MPQSHLSDETSSNRKKFLFRFARAKVLLISLIGILGATTLLSCASASQSSISTSATSSSIDQENGGFQHQAAKVANIPTDQQSSAVAKGIQSSAQRLIIESASLTITVSNVKTTTEQISQVVSGENGYVQSMNEFTNLGQSTTNMIIRVPETAYGGTLSTLKSYGTVSNLAQTGQDVTEEHTNLQEQIQELQSESDAYTRLYGKAQTMQDMLDIQHSLMQVNAEIADIQNQLHDLNRSVQLATITINLTSKPVSGAVKNITFPDALEQSIRFMGHVFVFMLNIIGWLLPWGVLVFPIAYGWSRWAKWRKSKSKP